MSHCTECQADMHPIDAQRSLVCHDCRRKRRIGNWANVRELKTPLRPAAEREPELKEIVR